MEGNHGAGQDPHRVVAPGKMEKNVHSTAIRNWNVK
jgi:hypothetical protein